MAKRYDPILCMLVDEPTKAKDELSLAQKKQVVIELKGFLKKSYNFSDESEYARAYEDLRHMFTTGSRKSISGLFENTVKKTGAHDVKARDVAPATQRYINTIVDENKANAEKFGYRFHDSASALDKAIRMCDEQIRLVKTISKKNGYAIHIVEGGYGERIVLTFPNESYANPHMWLGSNNSSNIQKAKELLNEFSK